MSIVKLKGHRVLLNRPEKKETGLKLTEELEASLIRDELMSMTSLEVFAVGSEVTDADIVEGAKVYISPSDLMRSEIVKVDGEDKIMARAMDVAIIW